MSSVAISLIIKKNYGWYNLCTLYNRKGSERTKRKEQLKGKKRKGKLNYSFSSSVLAFVSAEKLSPII